jgi:long-chain acyl-CoA synthetase
LLGESDVSLAILPWAHSFGQTCELWLGMAHRSSSAGICRGGVPSSILEDLQLVKPTILFAVPTLHKRIYDGVHNLMETASPIRKGLMKKALALGRKKSDEKKEGLESMSFMENIQFNALDKIVLFKIRDRFGGRLKRGYVGGAALPSEVINFLDDVGIPICEGYQWTYAAVVAELQYSVHDRILYAGKLILEDLLSRIMVFKQSRICTPCCSATFKLHFLTASVW